MAMSDEDLKILAEDIMQFIEAMEMACSEFRAQMAKLFGPEKTTWDPSKIKWTQTQGTRGPFEKSEDVDNPNFKAMLKDLSAHKGRMNREGHFYWTFPNGATVGRKKRGP